MKNSDYADKEERLTRPLNYYTDKMLDGISKDDFQNHEKHIEDSLRKCVSGDSYMKDFLKQLGTYSNRPMPDSLIDEYFGDCTTAVSDLAFVLGMICRTTQKMGIKGYLSNLVEEIHKM